MTSINRNQPEHNRKDLAAGDAITQMREIIDQNKVCFFVTTAADGSSGVRPMSCQQLDDAGNLWFLSPDDSHHNREIELDPTVKLFFQGSKHADFLYLAGRATISRDKAKIKELWQPLIKTWFTEGIDDPRITVIKVTPNDGYYWDTKHGHFVAGIKIMLGAALGKTLDDSIEGTLKP